MNLLQYIPIVNKPELEDASLLMLRRVVWYTETDFAERSASAQGQAIQFSWTA